jgi:hypothetical protein
VNNGVDAIPAMIDIAYQDNVEIETHTIMYRCYYTTDSQRQCIGRVLCPLILNEKIVRLDV